MRAFILVSLLAMSACVGGESVLDQESAAAIQPSPALKPLLWLVGNWSCSGRYLDTPLTVAHPNVASFAVSVGVGGRWIVGDYREVATLDNPAPVSVLDMLGVGPSGTGIRSFADSNTGQLRATYAVTAGSLDWTGTYSVAGLDLGFVEHLAASLDLRTFTTTSAVDLGGGPLVFQIETCNKPSSGTIARSTAP